MVRINEWHTAHGESRRLTRRRGKRVNTTVKPLRITGVGEFSGFVTILVIVFLVLVLFIVFVVGVTYIVVAFVVGLDLVALLLGNHLVLPAPACNSCSIEIVLFLWQYRSEIISMTF